MKRFVKKIIFFLFLGIAPFLITTSIIFFQKKKEVNAKIDAISRHEILIMGDSQMQRLFPSSFDTDAFNFACEGEHYYFTYCKMLKILEQDSCKVKHILLGISAHNFAPVYSKLFDPQYPEGRKSIEKYFYYIPGIKNDFLSPSDYLSRSLLKAIYEGPEWGGHTRSRHSKPDTSTINRTLNMHFAKGNIEEKHCESQLYYLLKIDSLCLAHDIPLYIISTPYHTYYRKKVEKVYYDVFEEAMQRIQATANLNFMFDDIDPLLMSDGNHLNIEGAELYSNKINDSVFVSQNLME